MDDVAAMRTRMVDDLVDKGYLKTAEIERAFRAVPRDAFLPGVTPETAYSGRAIPTRRDARGMPTSSSSEPAVMAVMLEQLQPRSGQRWLEVGTGTGYNAAVIAHLVGPAGAVTTIELQEDVAIEAREHLVKAGFPEVVVRAGDGWLGARDRAPFDRIESTASVEDLSPHWVEQLIEGGLLLVPLALRGASQALVAFQKRGEELASVSIRGGGFMRLRGEHEAPWRRLGVVVDDRTVTVTDPDLHLATIAELLRTEPRVEAAPAFHRDALSRLTLDEPGAVFISPPDDRYVFGIYDEERRSLALVDGEHLLIHGTSAAEDRLRAWLAQAPPLDESIEIVAFPAGRPRHDAARVIVRKHYAFMIRDR